MVIEITNNEFDSSSDLLAVVDFNASWCGPCRMLKPVFHELSEELIDIKFYSIDADANDELCNKFNVMSIPALFILKKGEIVDTKVGFSSKEDLITWIESNR